MKPNENNLTFTLKFKQCVSVIIYFTWTSWVFASYYKVEDTRISILIDFPLIIKTKIIYMYKIDGNKIG